MYCEPKAKVKLDLRAVVLSDLWIINILKSPHVYIALFCVKGCSCKLPSAVGCAAHKASLWLRYQGSGAGWGGGKGAGDCVSIQCMDSPGWWYIWKDAVCVCNWYCWACCSSREWECFIFKSVSQKLLKRVNSHPSEWRHFSCRHYSFS